MYPCIQIGQIVVPVFGVMLGCGIIVLTVFSTFQRADYGLSRGVLAGAVLAGMIAGVSGTVVAEWFTGGSLQGHITSNGMAGSLLAAAVGVKVWASAHRVPSLRLADCLTLPLALCVVIVPVGCFLAGCDFGKPTDQAWGVTFTSGVALAWYGTPLGVPLHPTQLYESALAGLMFGLLIRLRRRHPAEGTMFYAFVAMYAGDDFSSNFCAEMPIAGFLARSLCRSGTARLCFLPLCSSTFGVSNSLRRVPRGRESPPIRQPLHPQRSPPR